MKKYLIIYLKQIVFYILIALTMFLVLSVENKTPSQITLIFLLGVLLLAYIIVVNGNIADQLESLLNEVGIPVTMYFPARERLLLFPFFFEAYLLHVVLLRRGHRNLKTLRNLEYSQLPIKLYCPKSLKIYTLLLTSVIGGFPLVLVTVEFVESYFQNGFEVASMAVAVVIGLYLAAMTSQILAIVKGAGNVTITAGGISILKSFSTIYIEWDRVLAVGVEDPLPPDSRSKMPALTLRNEATLDRKENFYFSSSFGFLPDAFELSLKSLHDEILRNQKESHSSHDPARHHR